jgi:hypothetical protein
MARWRAANHAKGKSSKGNWPQSYWTTNCSKGKWPEKELRVAFNELLEELKQHRTFFHRMNSEDGEVEFFIGWVFDGNSGDILDCDLLGRMADLKIDLSLDIYPPDHQRANDEHEVVR